jgi:hypothetical protein
MIEFVTALRIIIIFIRFNYPNHIKFEMNKNDLNSFPGYHFRLRSDWCGEDAYDVRWCRGISGFGAADSQ